MHLKGKWRTDYKKNMPHLQYFLGCEGYKDELFFDPSVMVHFWKRLSGDILNEVYALIIEKSKADDEGRDDGDKGKGAGEGKTMEPENKGTLIVDASCAPEEMRFLYDVTPLDEARQKIQRIIDCL